MRKLLPIHTIFITCVLLLISLPSIVFAQENELSFEQKHQVYLEAYDQYRKLHTQYIRERNNYLTYQTLRAQTNLIEATKDMLVARDDVLITYIDLLFERNTQSLLADLLFQQKVTLLTHKEKIPAIATLSDIGRVSIETENQYPILEDIAYQVAGNILMQKIKATQEVVKTLENNLNQFIFQLETMGNDISTIQRWQIIVQNKILLAQQNMLDAQAKIAGLAGRAGSGLQAGYNDSRFTIFSANQYLKETTDLYREILEEIKYGNYTGN